MYSCVKLAAVAAMASSALAKTIPVMVGKSGFTFSPDTITAAKGDILEFEFFSPNHSVVMGDFSSACEPASTGGFYSGFMVVSSGEGSKTFSVMVNNTDPFPVYCSQIEHCQSGMVAVVNPTSKDSLAAYQKSASGTSSSGSPANVFGGTINSSSGSSTASACPAATSTSSSGGSGGGGGGWKRASDPCSTSSAASASSTSSGSGSGSSAGTMLSVSIAGVLAAAVMAAAML